MRGAAGWMVGVLLGLAQLGVTACQQRSGADPAVVERVDLRRYAGTWYEIASVPISQQEGCVDTRATYDVKEEGDIGVTNVCRDAKDGELRKAEGTATVPDPEAPAKLKVQFFWPFKGDYWILELDPDYEWALVGTPDREHAWVLSRTAKLDEAILARLLERLRREGYPLERLRRTPHPSVSPGQPLGAFPRDVPPDP